MSDGSLSQDEIDALLAGTGDIDLGESVGGGGGGSQGGSLDGFKRVLSGTVSQQQSNMAMVLGSEVELGEPAVNAGSPSGLSGEVVQIRYNFGEGGEHLYILSAEAATAIASATMGMEDIELDEGSLNAIQEVFSQVSGPVVNTLSETSGMTIMPEPPEATLVQVSELMLPDDPVYARYALTLGDGDSTALYEVFEASFAARFNGGSSGGGGSRGGNASAGNGGFGGMMGGQMGGQMGGMPMGGQNSGFGGPPGGGGMGNMMPGMMGGGANVQSVQFPSLQHGSGGSEHGNIGLLMDVYMEMTVELGRTKKLIREILGMGEGTIIELDKLAGEPVDILVNHKLIAKGEVVVIDENFGVRVTEIVSPMERVSDMT